jgi:hypothetical protein
MCACKKRVACVLTAEHRGRNKKPKHPLLVYSTQDFCESRRFSFRQSFRNIVTVESKSDRDTPAEHKHPR